MRLSQPLSYPKPPQDFYTEQMRKLSRDTSTMMLHMLDMIPETKSDMYVELNSMLTADWDDSTHTNLSVLTATASNLIRSSTRHRGDVTLFFSHTPL